MKTIREFNLGDRVKFSRLFLRSIFAYTGPLPFLRGTVIGIKTLPRSKVVIITVQWDNVKRKAKINWNNLVLENDAEYSSY